MATPEAVFLQRIAQAQESDQESGRRSLSQIMTRRSVELAETEPFQAIDSLNLLIEELENQDPFENLEEVFLERLGQLHEAEPETFPRPEEVLVADRSRFGDRFPFIRDQAGRGGDLSPEEQKQRNALRQLWRVVRADLESRRERAIAEAVGERLKQKVRGFGGALQTSVGGIDEIIREVDPTTGARETVRRQASEGVSALAELLRSAGGRIAEGAGTAREVLGQGATDLEFLLREIIRDEIIGDGDADFPASNPRAVRAERFAEGPRETLGRRLFGDSFNQPNRR